jgi:3-phosphoshikimate 1-carboxyvinyltransferase
MVAAKCLLPKGTFSISNMPLETWATPVLSFIRKMGGKVSVQETHRTSFGSTGILSIQKCDLVGRKVECKPAGNFETHLPAMIILAAFAKGQSVFRGLEDLRNNEPDGIDFLESCIRTLGARHGEMPDGIVMDGGRDFDGFDLQGVIPAHIAGSLAIAGLKCMGTTTIEDELLLQRWPLFEGMVKSYTSQNVEAKEVETKEVEAKDEV